MQAPKILPRIASQAGISEELALKLWRRACSEAEYLSGQATGSEYFGLAVDRWLAIVGEESGQPSVPGLMPAAQISWIWQHQSRLSQLSLLAARNAYLSWQNLYTYRQAA